MSKKSASKRNRHTGRINAATAHIIEKGTPVRVGNTIYHAIRHGIKQRLAKPSANDKAPQFTTGGVTLVRMS